MLPIQVGNTTDSSDIFQDSRHTESTLSQPNLAKEPKDPCHKLEGSAEAMHRTIYLSTKQQSSPLIRIHAVWAVYRLALERAGEYLKDAMSLEVDEGVLEEYSWWRG